MPISVRRRLTLLAVSLSVLPALSAAPEWVADTIDEIRDYPESRQIIQTEAVRRGELQVESDWVLHRIGIKESILDEVEAGRVSLFDAANRFRLMDRERPEIVAVPYPPERLGSEAEISAHSVIRHMHSRRDCGRPLVAGTILRLHASFEKAYGYDPSDN